MITMTSQRIKLLPIIMLFLTMNWASQAQEKKAHFNHEAIFVTDLQRSTAFYRDVIRLDTIPEPFHDNAHTWFSIGAGIELHVIQGADARKEYFKNNHMCFSVPSMDAFTSTLKKSGMVYENVKGEKGQVTTRPDGIHQIWFQDPDGYWIEINDVKY
jgi:lactoylglutathione lyase